MKVFAKGFYRLVRIESNKHTKQKSKELWENFLHH